MSMLQYHDIWCKVHVSWLLLCGMENKSHDFTVTIFGELLRFIFSRAGARNFLILIPLEYLSMLEICFADKFWISGVTWVHLTLHASADTLTGMCRHDVQTIVISFIAPTQHANHFCLGQVSMDIHCNQCWGFNIHSERSLDEEIDRCSIKYLFSKNNHFLKLVPDLQQSPISLTDTSNISICWLVQCKI